MTKKNKSANNFLKIKDIRQFLYKSDDTVLAYIKVYPKNCKLMSNEEQYIHSINLAAQFASENKRLKFYFTNRPVDISKIIDNQIRIMEKTTDNQIGYLLDQRLNSISQISTSGYSLECEIYIIIDEKESEYVEEEIIKRANDIIMKLNNVNYKSELLTEKEIIQLCNSYSNPENAYIEDQNYLNMGMFLNI